MAEARSDMLAGSPGCLQPTRARVCPSLVLCGLHVRSEILSAQPSLFVIVPKPQGKLKEHANLPGYLVAVKSLNERVSVAW